MRKLKTHSKFKRILATVLSLQLMCSLVVPGYATGEPQASETFVSDEITYQVTGENTVQVGDGKTAMAPVGAVSIPAAVSHGGKTYKVTAVGDKAFWKADKLTSVTLTDNITSLGELSFSRSGLTSFTMPNSVVTIGKNALAATEKMTEVTISNALPVISESAFQGSGIKTLTIPEGVTTLSKNAFASCASLQTLSLPASLTTIGEQAFWSNGPLREVTIAAQSQLTSIGDKAFQFDENMKKINLPAGLQVVGESAFANCKQLSDIGLGQDSQLTTLGTSAFAATGLASFHFPATVKTVGDRPLGGCEKLTAITVAEGNTLYQSVDGVLMSKDGKTLVQYPAKKSGTSYTVPAGVTAIADYAFLKASKLGELVVPAGVTTIGDHAFESMGMLNTLTMNDTVKSLGYLAIYKCNNLEELVLPNGITELGKYTISNCPSLMKVTIGTGVTAMAANTFGNCSALADITILSEKLTTVPKNAFSGTSEDLVVTVPNEAVKQLVVASGAANVVVNESQKPDPQPVDVTFVGADGLTYKTNGIGTVQVGDGKTSMTGLSGTITIPAAVEHEGVTYQVTAIADKAFTDLYSVSKVVFAEGSQVASIGVDAFNATKVNNVVLPASVRSLGTGAFKMNASLTAITLNDGLVSMGNEVFYNCSKLMTIKLPATLTTLGNNVFDGCKYLKSIDVAAGNTAYASESGVLFNADKTTLLLYPAGKKDVTEYVAPAAVKHVANGAFNGNQKAVSVTLPDGLLTIGEKAFNKALNLETVNLGKSLTTIGKMAFYQCTNLGAVTIPASVTKIDGYAFAKCTSASYTVSSEEIKAMMVAAGADESAITVVAAPTSVTFVVDGITYKSTGEDTVQVGDGKTAMAPVGAVSIPAAVSHEGKTYKVTAVGDKAFWKADKLTSVTLTDNITSLGELSFSRSGLTSFTMPNSVVTIGKNALAATEKMTEVTISNALPVISESAFQGSGIKTLTIPEGVTTLSKNAFASCASLQTLSLPASLTTIGEQAFWSNGPLREVTIAAQSQLTSIGDKAFQFDENMKKINLPAGLQVVGESAFANCKQLSDIGLGQDSQLTTLGTSAFAATGLASFHFPATVKTVGDRPLGGCEKLTAITVAEGNTLYQSVDGVLMSKDGKTLVQYPAKKSGTSYTVPAGVTAIADYAFLKASKLGELVVPAGVTTIGDHAFESMGMLNTLTMNDTVKSLGYLAIYKCNNLEELVLPNGITELGKYTISNCPSLMKVTIGTGVTAMAANTFGNCSALTDITILSEKLTTIPKNAFSGTGEGLLVTVPNEAVKSAVVGSGVPAESVVVKESEKPTPAVGEFTVNDVTYLVLTQAENGKNGTVAVGNGKDGIAATGIVTIPASVKNNGLTYDVVKVSQVALKNSAVTELRLPDSVKMLDEMAFNKAPKLVSFEIPAGLEVIADNAISDCPKLKTITYAPNSSLTTLGNGALCGNAILETIELPNTITDMGTHTMYWNNCLREVTFQPGSTWTALPNGTFMRDFKLERVNNLPDGMTSIGLQAFYGCEVLEAIDLSKITEIGEQAFWNCRTLESVTLNDSLTVLESGTFEGCSGLKTVKLGKDLTRLGAISADGDEEPTGVFQGCSSLTEIRIPAKVTSFGKATFQGCTSLAKVEILAPDFNEIGANAFYELAPDVQFYVVNEEMKAFLADEALLDKNDIHVMDEQPEQPENILKIEALGNGGVGQKARITTTVNSGFFLVQITAANGENTVYTVPVPASGELMVSFGTGCHVSVWQTAQQPELTAVTPNAGGQILGSARL